MNYRKMRLRGLIDKVVADTEGRRALDFCFVLGAGASISSGIPSGQKLVARWEKELAEAYADHEDWKAKHGITADNMAEHYSDYYHAKFPERFEGYNYLEGIMQGASPSAGYAALAYLLCRKGHRLVITTNFDPMTEDAIRLLEHEHPLVIGHESLAELIRDKTSRPTVVKIHRDLLMRPKNEAAEVAELADAWKENLPYVFENYHPIFVGYAGNDGSLMNWLQENADKFRSGAWKTPYWTLYGREVLSGKAKTFMETAGGSVISECDFDELMIILAAQLGYQFPKKEDYLRQCEADWTRISDKLNEVLSGKKPEPPASGGDPSSTAPAGVEAGEADLMFRKAIGSLVDPTDPPDEENRYRSALIAWRHARDSEAETILRALCADFPENAKYHYSLGVTLHKMQRYEDALAESRRAVELEPENAEYHYSLGVTLHAMQRYDEALAEIRRAVELEPENARYHQQKSVTLHAMQRYEDALAEKRRAVELEPENAKWRDSLAVTLDALGQKKAAEKERKQAWALRDKQGKK
jgi:tetratricopeptide (TPR) repeat protein